MEPKLYSYVVDHDYGRSPNPLGGLCTLAFCKYRLSAIKRRNIVELARVGDWVVGTSGVGQLSVGVHGRLVYAMLVTEKMCLRDYFCDERFTDRAGNDPQFARSTSRFSLISDHFHYFGSTAPQLSARHREYPIERGGRGYRSKFPNEFIDDFLQWLNQFPTGVQGEPCARWPG